MRQETITVYTFNELSETAKNKARDWYLSGLEFPWFNEYLDSIKAFCDEFGVTLEDYSLGSDYRDYIKTNANNSHFRGFTSKDCQKLKVKDLTGFCGDSLKDEFCQLFLDSGDALHSFNKSLTYILKVIRDDIEDFYSQESIDEMLDINGYEFLASGAIH